MANTSRILCLPAHITSLILEKLTEKKDRRMCLTVCKLWEYIASDFADVPVKARADQLQKLLDDIPYFGHRVFSIRITLHDNKLDPKKTSILWRDIIMMCPKLMYIYLSDLAYEFLKSLYSSDAELKKIRDIHIIYGPLPQSIDVQRIHLKTAFRYRATITSLKMCSGDINHASKNCNGLINFVQNFPNLTNLRIYCTDESNVDVNQILGSAPYLQVLKLYNFETITCIPQDSENGEQKENTHLAILKLITRRLDITSFLQIATQMNQVLTHVINFQLIVCNIIRILDILSSSEMLTVVARIKRVKMEFPVEDLQRFRVDKGKSPSLSTSEIYRDHYTYNPSADWLDHLDTMEKFRVDYDTILAELMMDELGVSLEDGDVFELESLEADIFQSVENIF